MPKRRVCENENCDHFNGTCVHGVPHYHWENYCVKSRREKAHPEKVILKCSCRRLTPAEVAAFRLSGGQIK
jgi:hypothetical protein